MKYAEFDEINYTDFKMKLIQNKESLNQEEFLHIVRDTPTFISYMRTQIGFSIGDEILQYNERLSEDTFKILPPVIEKKLFKIWDNLPPSTACRSSFWAYVTFKHIEAGIIDSSYLAATGGSRSEGKYRIDMALTKKNKSDPLVRDVLRCMGGLPEIRGNRSVLTNCFFGRAWWRGHISKLVCAETGGDLDKINLVLTKNQRYWEGLISLIVSQNPVLGDVSVFSALICSLADQIGDVDDTILFNEMNLKSLVKMIEEKQAFQELGVQEIHYLKYMFKNVFFPKVFIAN